MKRVRSQRHDCLSLLSGLLLGVKVDSGDLFLGEDTGPYEYGNQAAPVWVLACACLVWKAMSGETLYMCAV